MKHGAPLSICIGSSMPSSFSPSMLARCNHLPLWQITGTDLITPIRLDETASQPTGSLTHRGGAVFMNPPYGRTIGLFMRKALTEANRGCVVVCLVPARTDTAWYHDTVIAGRAEVRFLRGRLRFNDGPNAAPFPSCVAILGRDRSMTC